MKISILHKIRSPVLLNTEKVIRWIDRGILGFYNKHNESVFNIRNEILRRSLWIRN